MHKISTPQQMLEYGIALAKEHKILLLHGELGAGKTLLAKGFAQGL
jgi:tRNA A37 threonylcarbamoyladenosine biosynthesis protein TsaE